MQNTHTSAYLIIIALAVLIVSPNLLNEGMFSDGLYYAAIAKHMSDGVGSIWVPYFSPALQQPFYGHPPLAFWLQSGTYHLLGTGIWVDKIYSIFVSCLSGILLVRLAKMVDFKQGWLVLLFWFSVPIVLWAVPNNMLENTVQVFVLASTLAFVAFKKGGNWAWLALAGLFLALGFLTKGFVALFPLVMPMVYAICFHKWHWRVLLETSILVLSAVVPITIVCFLQPNATYALEQYVQTQVVESVLHVQTVPYRLFVMERWLAEVAPMFFISVLLIYWAKRITATTRQLGVQNHGWSRFFFLVSMAGVLPMMVSLKQRGFYILPVFPLTALAFALWVQPSFVVLYKRYKPRYLRVLAISLSLLAILASMYFKPRPCRDTIAIADIKQILTVVPPDQIIQIAPEISSQWDLYAYFSRYGRVSLDPANHESKYYLTSRRHQQPDTSTHTEVPLQTTEYQLFRKHEQAHNK
jgi:4-amino-4-deoxy-L-arabinose transferase-like glycosyltransferase